MWLCIYVPMAVSARAHGHTYISTQLCIYILMVVHPCTGFGYELLASVSYWLCIMDQWVECGQAT
jgi:hypothetical protein